MWPSAPSITTSLVVERALYENHPGIRQQLDRVALGERRLASNRSCGAAANRSSLMRGAACAVGQARPRQPDEGGHRDPEGRARRLCEDPDHRLTRSLPGPALPQHRLGRQPAIALDLAPDARCSSTLRVAVAVHLNDRRAGPGERALQGPAQLDGRGHQLVLEAVQRGRLREVQARGRRDVACVDVLDAASTRRALSPPLGGCSAGSGPSAMLAPATARKSKMPPPSLSSSTIVSSGPAAVRPAGRRCRVRARRRRSAARPGPRRRPRAERRGHGAVDAVGAAVAEHARRVRRGRGQKVSMSRTGIEEATNSVACAGSSTPSSRPPPARRARPPERPAIASAARSSARRQLASQSASAALRAEPRLARRARVRRERAGGLERERAREHRCGVLPGALGVERQLATPPSPASQLRSGLDTGRSPTRSTRSGRCAAANACVAQQRVVVGDRGLAAAGARQRVGQQRPAGGLRRSRRRPRRAAVSRSWRPATSTPRRASATSSRRRRCAAVARGDRRRGAVRRTYGRAVAAAAVVGGQLLLAHQRLAQREVQVHRPGAALERRPVGAAGERADPAQLLGAGAPCEPTSKNHLAALAEQLELVDRLPGAVLAQLGRAVGGEHAAAAPAPRAPRSRRGSSSAAAVPDVHATATGRPDALASPSAKKPAQRSSTCE